MSSQHSDSAANNQHLDEVITAYLKWVESGSAPDQQAWLTRYPELAMELAAFFAGQKQVQQLAGQLHPTIAPANAAQQAPTLAPGEPPAAHHLARSAISATTSCSTKSHGGMGVVYRARQVSLNRIVALKMILAGNLASPEDVRRFHVEAEAAAKLDHPGIVPIFEVGEQDGLHYFSMGFVEGESLAHRIAAGMLQPREAANLTKGIAQAIAYAHAQGVVHRDLKPANVLLDKMGQPRVTDFGLAKHADRRGNVRGAPRNN